MKRMRSLDLVIVQIPGTPFLTIVPEDGGYSVTCRYCHIVSRHRTDNLQAGDVRPAVVLHDYDCKASRLIAKAQEYQFAGVKGKRLAKLKVQWDALLAELPSRVN